MKSWFPFLPLVVGLVLTSCGRQPDVIVTDRAGLPIAGAKVEPVSASINYEPVLTDDKGHASIPSTVQKVETLNVTAPGSGEKVRVPYKGGKPLRVVLPR